MLRVVRSDDRRSWGILASCFCRRVDPDRLGKSFPARRPVNEALGMRRVGGQARPIPDVQPRLGPAVVHVDRRQIPQATVMMRVVVPPEQRVADGPRILDRSEAIGKLRPIFERPELGFRKRIVVAHAALAASQQIVATWIKGYRDREIIFHSARLPGNAALRACASLFPAETEKRMSCS